ncbi:HET-domain-containing protein [Xylaria telfairii]|nr:HET-domain-containing protein [Xylaria telfairii]
MWLLNTHSQELEEFISHKHAPPYVILSHTWGKEEVSFREWRKGCREDVGKKEGFSKIIRCCKEAATNGFEWVWIDTCCIDKRSSAELSEAINSMFQWYKSADTCYAYLCDVQSDVESNLAGSRWVTRGWTLQELIAPREVIFYSADWKALGKRSEISAHLSIVTQIDKRFLMGESLKEASIAQRMSWAALRNTTREEDEAYCLLGIFDVNMSLIYGEGSKAFKRLQEVLVRKYPEDHSLFAWGKVIDQVPNQVDDPELVRGSKPPDIKRDHKEAGNGLRGLLAKSPREFQDAGQLVCAPNMHNYFWHSKIPIPVSIGDTWRVEFPFYPGCFRANFLKFPPITQLLFTSFIILLCGKWNASKTEFCFVTVPITDDYGSRLEGIIISNKYTAQRLPVWDLSLAARELRIKPLVPLPPRNGHIVVRRHGSNLTHRFLLHSEVNMIPSFGSIVVPSHVQGSLLARSYWDSEQDGFVLVMIRLEALDHPHKDPTEGKTCGSLKFKISPYFIKGKSRRKFHVMRGEEDSRAPAAKQKFRSLSFEDHSEANNYSRIHWEKISAWERDVVVPRDEWRLSIIGVADVYISVERMFRDQYGTSDDPGNDGSHPWVDVLDIVVTRNTDDDSTSEENESETDSNEGASDEEEAGSEAIEEDGRARTEMGGIEEATDEYPKEVERNDEAE